MASDISIGIAYRPQLRNNAPTVKPPRKRTSRPLTCRQCGDRLHVFEGEKYCLGCTLFVPFACPTPRVVVTVAGGAPEELLQRLHDLGWDVHVRLDLDALLFHPAVRTAAEARGLLERQGLALELFAIEG